MGNILSLTRDGWQNNGSFANMDILDYDYDVGNKLTKVTDTGNDAHGFRDGTNTNDDFEYDGNGNLILDRNKGITGVTYNHLNLPIQVTFNSGNIQYVYAADGTKLKRSTSTGTETLYAGNYIYENGTLQFFNTSEGTVLPKNVDDYSAGFDYVYNYVDHLGNVRLSYTDNNGTVEIVKESNYYPFGLSHKGYNGGVSPLGNSVAKKYMFGGKELDESLGLETYDFGARNYDPALGRWMNLDPLAEQMRRHSPYNYAFNNPLRFIDPDGMSPDDIIFNLLLEDGSTVELARIETDIEAEFNIEASEVPFFDLENYESLVIEAGDFEIDSDFDLQAVSFDLSGEIAAEAGVQAEVSFIGMLKGPDKGETVQVNGLLGFEGGATGSVSFYQPGQEGENLFLNDLQGFETGLQGTGGYVNGSVFSGFKFISSAPYTEDVYNGFSVADQLVLQGLRLAVQAMLVIVNFFIGPIKINNLKRHLCIKWFSYYFFLS